MGNSFYQRYYDMNHETRKRTEENLTAMIESVEKVRLFVNGEAADKLISDAFAELQFIHRATAYRGQQVLDALSELDMTEIVKIWNAYVKIIGSFDDEIFEMEQFNDAMGDTPPLIVVINCFHGDFDPDEMYWYYDDDGELRSFDFLDDDNSPINLRDVAAYMVEHGETFGIKKVAEILQKQYIEE